MTWWALAGIYVCLGLIVARCCHYLGMFTEPLDELEQLLLPVAVVVLWPFFLACALLLGLMWLVRKLVTW